jgi:membrane fusion protein (multidrug efflux system)
VSVADNQTVRAGQVLARIDDRDYRAAMAQGEAEIAEAQAGQAASAAQITEQQAQIAQAQADIESDQAQLQFAALEQQRASRLSVTGSGTAQAVDRTQAQVRQDLAALKHAQAALRSSQAKIESFKAGIAFAEANLLKAQADTERARLNLEHTVLTAPIDGIVGDRSLRPGLYVRPGVGLLTIVPSGQALYVTANFKETQLHHMQPGQTASFTADAFGDHVFRGHVDSISPGTGAQFSLLPPENATGNFTKIVQRVPVKIRLDGVDPWTSRLRSGLSVAVSIDTRHDRLAGGRG